MLRSTIGVFAAVLAVWSSRPSLLPAQGVGTGGALAIARAPASDGTWKRVLMIGAHPDDEYTDLIALLARGEGVETAYLSLTRGEGGQNLIGSELGAALGLLRTEELLAARRIDGGLQFFTRAFDFGYSKSAEETFTFWPREELLEDVVRVIRQFRPQVIVSVWSGTPRDGHGHHTVAGIIAREAFDVAADPSRFPQAGPPHQAAKFYLAPYTLPPDAAMLQLDGGRVEAASGLTMHQLAARSRSQHRSQDMGSLEEPGPWPVRIALTAVAPGVTAGAGDAIFAGIAPDTPRGNDPAVAAGRLAEAGIVVDAYASQDEVALGDSVRITMLVVNNSPDTITARLRLSRHEWPGGGMDSSPCGDTVHVAPGKRFDCHFTRMAAGRLSQPYFLQRPLRGAMYDFGEPATYEYPETFGRPFGNEPFAMFILHARGRELSSAVRPIRGRRLDQGLGEVRRPLVIVPRVAVEIQPGMTLLPQGTRSRIVEVHLEHLSRDTTGGTVVLHGPAGWSVSAPRNLTFTRPGERTTVPFTIQAPSGAHDTVGEFDAMFVSAGDTMRLAIHRIYFPHIDRRIYFTPARSEIVVAPVTFAARSRVGYVRGAADAIPDALANSGVRVRLLGEGSLESAVLDSLDVVVIGPRAYEVDPTIRAAHPRIMAWVNAGGTLIVQYQQYQYINGGFAPRPVTISRPHDRVTDENAAVRILAPSHPVFRYPNVITDDDFSGWVQERGLYFAGTWNAAWMPLLEMADPGEPPAQGGMLIANVGKGRVVYTGLAFFRQIPAAVPGAWRLFANLLALGEPRAR